MRLSFSGCGRAKRWTEGKDSKKFGEEEPGTRQPVDCSIFKSPKRVFESCMRISPS